MSLEKDEWRAGMTEDRNPVGCAGCLLIVLACLALDALTLFAGYQIVILVRDIIAG
ncbi:MAG: hypothetical protein MR874_06800 [Coriobacteriaceae bacterium]|uniref:hypothetical protein n=1 Tax=Tractidigestivibacter sp. TaxID=2847320 RepID=UPI002A7F4D45|nr:hypothetical protein [Tractidigestivibacter sp.]MCI6274413.1 hypothetical protein [Coriobacteriaceae bacterium]MCI6548210.1 hypothetical protein [Coriobacteriaceae bacterium]MCI6844450.1 hypothetical protein [Coriobacteriaceae bacterium]MDY4535471.1 hypothetical protein [Tractidigestivibacter sp.]MDY5272144.1 hypothetical protein [Tractidigestivibacter sp.]